MSEDLAGVPLQPSKYDWNKLKQIEVGEIVTLPNNQYHNAAKAIQRLRTSKYIFTQRKIDDNLFTIRRVH